MYHFSNHQLYHQNVYQQQCQLFVDHTKQPNHSVSVPTPASPPINQLETVHNTALSDTVTADHTVIETRTNTTKSSSNNKNRKEVVKRKSNVDTSQFSVEERVVAAVWVHERKQNKWSMRQIKHNFHERFGREPPAKNTLLAWEKKLFSTGSIHDAPRPGRPVHRVKHLEAVSRSVCTSPLLSLRARALELRLPRTTLRTILRRDLPHSTHKQYSLTGKHQVKNNLRRIKGKNLNKSTETGDTCNGLLSHTYT